MNPEAGAGTGATVEGTGILHAFEDSSDPADAAAAPVALSLPDSASRTSHAKPPGGRGVESRQGSESPRSRNLAEVATRIRSGRCNLLLVGDSIASNFALGDRGTWVTGIWRAWRPESWRGRFVPAAMHGVEVNGTTVANGGVAPAFDPACRLVTGSTPGFPGEDFGPYFEPGHWGLLVNGFETLGDLEDRSLARFDLPSNVGGVDYWSRYRGDANWSGDRWTRACWWSGLRPRFPIPTPRSPLRRRVDVAPGRGHRFRSSPRRQPTAQDPLRLRQRGVALGVRRHAVLRSPDRARETEVSGSMMFLGCIFERNDRENGLLLGSHSVGGDTTGAHLAGGDLLQTDGPRPPVLRGRLPPGSSPPESGTRS